nr:MAG TPA: hypothetical protein [Caudoviricetes sp.]
MYFRITCYIFDNTVVKMLSKIAAALSEFLCV